MRANHPRNVPVGTGSALKTPLGPLPQVAMPQALSIYFQIPWNFFTCSAYYIYHNGLHHLRASLAASR